MFEHMPLSTWIPVFAVAFVFAIAGIALAVASLRAGQYRDPEAAKFEVLGDDAHPAGGPDRTGAPDNAATAERPL